MDSIYIHIPFCIKKCEYCDFLSFSNVSDDEREKYVKYLIKEIKLYPKYKVDTIYFGGGTPSILKPSQVKKILENINYEEGAEITLEVNPKTTCLERLRGFKKAGVNRISIGVQSFQEKFLKSLGRQHNSDEAIKIYNEARKAGFENISLDLMFALPEQTLDDLEKDLDKLFELAPEHFSIYSLIWEEGTEFHKKLLNGELKEADNDLEADMYSLIIKKAKENGYIHYEISNFCKAGRESKHNNKYWDNKEYLGVGLGASGYINNIRYKNIYEFSEYYDKIEEEHKPIFEQEKVSEEEKEVYRNILGLRLLTKSYTPNKKFENIFKKLEQDGYLICKEDNKYVLSEKGLFMANDVFEKLL